MKNRFYGWTIAFCGLLALTISNGMSFTGITAFDKTLLDIYGWQQNELKLGITITIMVAGVFAPIFGRIAQKIGIRKVMILGCITQSLGYINYAFADTLPKIYFTYFLFGITLACAGLAIVVMMVSRWFLKERGTALGLAIAGTSVGAIVMSKLNVAMLNVFGLKIALLYMSLVPMIVLLPVILFVIKEFPQDKNTVPLGFDPDNQASKAALDGMSFQEALRTWPFWALGIISTLTFFCMIGLLALLMLYLQKAHGLNPQDAQALFAIPSLAALFGKFFFGWLAERIKTQYVLWTNMSIMIIGAAMLSTQTLGSTYTVGALLFGLGWGGIYSILQLLIMNQFGLKDSGKILGGITAMDTIGGGLGPIVLSIVATKYGWAMPFQITLVLLVICFALSFTLGDRREALKR
jgi:MFS family permease